MIITLTGQFLKTKINLIKRLRRLLQDPNGYSVNSVIHRKAVMNHYLFLNLGIGDYQNCRRGFLGGLKDNSLILKYQFLKELMILLYNIILIEYLKIII